MCFKFQAEDVLEAVAILAIAIVAGEKVSPVSIAHAVTVLHQCGRNPMTVCDQLLAIGSKLHDYKDDGSIF